MFFFEVLWIMAKVWPCSRFFLSNLTPRCLAWENNTYLASYEFLPKVNPVLNQRPVKSECNFLLLGAWECRKKGDRKGLISEQTPPLRNHRGHFALESFLYNTFLASKQTGDFCLIGTQSRWQFCVSPALFWGKTGQRSWKEIICDPEWNYVMGLILVLIYAHCMNPVSGRMMTA